MAGALRQIAEALDQRMESFILRSRTDDTDALNSKLGLLVLASLPAAALLKYLTGPLHPLDLFVLALILCCMVFRQRGFMAVGLALGLDLLVKGLEIIRLGRPDLWKRFLLDSALSGVEWTLVCSFVVITLQKWAALRSVQSRTDDDLALAKSLQSSLARKTCDLQRVKICGSIHQCDAVGGDFYYFRPFGKKMLSFCIGDVMGKGISASLLMAMVMSFVYEWGKQSCNPATIAERLNRRLCYLWDGRKGWFITIFYAILDEETGLLEYCAAGQQGGFILREGEIIELATECDPPLGVVEPFQFTPHSVQLQPHDHLLLFTDGAYEAKSPNGELFGTDRLKRLFQRFSTQHGQVDFLHRLEKEILIHTGGLFTDDTTLLSVRYLPQPEVSREQSPTE
jgi:serine phosphatase RsbU (regulator of sigma subunit)